MPPVLDPSKSKVDGLAFLGLSLTRWSPEGHPESETHQTSYDLNDVLDRNYEYLFSTNDDGWLVGGGEPGPPTSYKLAAKDSSHVEIMRIGTYREDWGGLDLDKLLIKMQSGEILIPQIEVVPTAVVANPDNPPELEIRFDMEPEVIDCDDLDVPLPTNWQLRFLHNQLFKTFVFPSRFCPGAFHSTILRKAEFRSDEHRRQYFQKCHEAIAKWRELGPQPLNTVPRGVDGQPLEVLQSKESEKKEKGEDKEEQTKGEQEEEKKDNEGEKTATDAEGGDVDDAHMSDSVENTTTDPAPKADVPAEDDLDASSPSTSPYQSGIWLFTDRENISHFFKPNFLPPYTGEKKKIILDVLKDEWDESTLSWKPIGHGSMTKNKAPAAETKVDSLSVAQLTTSVTNTASLLEEKDNHETKLKSGPETSTDGAAATSLGDMSINVNKLETMVDEVLDNIFENSCCSPTAG